MDNICPNVRWKGLKTAHDSLSRSQQMGGRVQVVSLSSRLYWVKDFSQKNSKEQLLPTSPWVGVSIGSGLCQQVQQQSSFSAWLAHTSFSSLVSPVSSSHCCCNSPKWFPGDLWPTRPNPYWWFKSFPYWFITPDDFLTEMRRWQLLQISNQNLRSKMLNFPEKLLSRRVIVLQMWCRNLVTALFRITFIRIQRLRK